MPPKGVPQPKCSRDNDVKSVHILCDSRQQLSYTDIQHYANRCVGPDNGNVSVYKLLLRYSTVF